MRLFALVSLLALSAVAHADLLPQTYVVTINGTVSASSFYLKIPTGGYSLFEADLAKTGITFIEYPAVTTPYLSLPIMTQPVTTVEFTGYGTDFITGIKLEPGATITGILPSTSSSTSSIGATGLLTTKIDFDFTRASVDPFKYQDGYAHFDFALTPAFPTPEIDPSLAASGLILLAGAIAILRSCRSRPQATPCS